MKKRLDKYSILFVYSGMKIKEQMTFKEYFNTYKSTSCFDKKGAIIKSTFHKTLSELNLIIENGWDDKSTCHYRNFCRLMLGYNATSYGNGITSGAYTEEWKRKKDVNKSYKGTSEHPGGCLAVGLHIVNVFKENNLDIEYMVDKWLPENLYLWATIKVTKEEHKKENILRDPKMSIEDKLAFKHYVNTSPVVFPCVGGDIIVKTSEGHDFW